MTFDVRTISESELRGWVDQMGLGFHHVMAEGVSDYLRGVYDLDRTWGAFDGTRVVGTLRSFPTALTVPGPAEVPAAALTNVTVAPTHRRRGILTEMITKDLRASLDIGEPLGILIASEWPIYGRFGYGPAAEAAKYKVDTVGLQWRRQTEGRVELSDREELRKVGPDLYEHFRRSQPGSIERPDHWWDRTLRTVEIPGDEPFKSRVALYRSPAGALEGYVVYEAKPDWDDMRPRGKMSLTELVALNPGAYQGLWDFCCSVDLLATVEAGERSVDEMLPLMLVDGRLVKLTSRFDFLWVRVLDVARALTGRRYSTEGKVVLEVVDPIGLADGRFALDVGPEGAECIPTDAGADLTMPVDTLGACYLGGDSFARLRDAGRLDENRAGAANSADLMFQTSRAPWCTTWF